MAQLVIPSIDTHSSSKSVTFSSKSARNKPRRKKKRNKPRSFTPKSARISRRVRFTNTQKKLGPRDIGRNKYPQGTKYTDADGGHFLKEKIHHRSRSCCFLERKKQNPVEHRPTVEETGAPLFWDKPEYYDKEVQKMNSFHNEKRKGWGGPMTEFLTEKPSKPKDSRLEALKNTKIPKGKGVKEYGAPNSWKPIAFKYENKGGGFLDEKFWFEGSHVQVDGGLSKLIEALPPKMKLQLTKLPAPTGYQSKINFLRKLRHLVMKEVRRIHREDTMIQQMETKVFIDGIANEIEKQYERELDDALDEVLAEYDDNKRDKKDIVVTLEMKSDDDDDDVTITDKYTTLMERRSTPIGMYQRKMFTMQSVNTITNIIDGIESDVVE